MGIIIVKQRKSGRRSMTYQEAEKYILDVPKFTKKNGLDNTRELIKELGNPEKNIKIRLCLCIYLIHVDRSRKKNRLIYLTSLGENYGTFSD
jgi:hypothetical protein